MRTVTEETVLYSFDELSERAKDRAREFVSQWLSEGHEPQFTTEWLEETGRNVFGIVFDSRRWTNSHGRAGSSPCLYWSTYPSECAFDGCVTLQSLRAREAGAFPGNSARTLGDELLNEMEFLDRIGLDYSFRASHGRMREFNLNTDCELEMPDGNELEMRIEEIVSNLESSFPNNDEFQSLSSFERSAPDEDDIPFDCDTLFAFGVLADWCEVRGADEMVSALRWCLLAVSDPKAAESRLESIRETAEAFLEDVAGELATMAQNDIEYQGSEERVMEEIQNGNFAEENWTEDGEWEN
ncbi:MAG TPA: hypothetical protein VIY86_11640 [Pirellulaceae bacterium]